MKRLCWIQLIRYHNFDCVRKVVEISCDTPESIEGFYERRCESPSNFSGDPMRLSAGAPGGLNDMMAVTTTPGTTRWQSSDMLAVTGQMVGRNCAESPPVSADNEHYVKLDIYCCI